MSRRLLLMCGLIACLCAVSITAQRERQQSKRTRNNPPGGAGSQSQPQSQKPALPTSQQRRNEAKANGDRRKSQAAAAPSIPSGAVGSRGVGVRPLRISSVVSRSASPGGGYPGGGSTGTGCVLVDGIVYCPNAQGKYFISGFLYIICGEFLTPEDYYICCDGTFYPTVVDGQPVECCAGNYFIPATEICCDPYYYPKFKFGYPVECCGVDYFVPEFEICCGGQFADKLVYGCCADSLFLLSSFCCFAGNQLPIGNPFCLFGGGGGGGGNKCADSRYICCDGTPHLVKFFGYKCCGKQYIRNEYSCCGNVRPYCASLYNCCPGPNGNVYLDGLDTCCANGDVVPSGSDCTVSGGGHVYYKK